MYSKLIRTTLIATALAPILLTISFNLFNNFGSTLEAFGWLGGATLLVILAFFILNYAPNSLERFSEGVITIKNGDAEVVVFLLAYLLPLFSGMTAKIDYPMALYIAVVLMFVFWNSNCLYFNPVLKLLGFHVYEITFENQVNAILITKRTLRAVPRERLILVRLAEYVFLEKEKE